MVDRTELERLLEEAKGHVMTPREIWLQRVSFVYGQMMDCSPGITREDVEARAAETYGPCPALDPTDEDYDDMLHAMGRPALPIFDEVYRNYYCCAADSDQSRRFEALGCWDFVRFINEHRGNLKDAIYEVNGVGKQALERWMKK